MIRQFQRSGWCKRMLLGAVAVQLAVVVVAVPPALPGEYAAAAAERKKKVKDKYSDTCAPLRAPFTRIKNEQFGQTVGGALLGGLLGAVVGSQIKKKTIVTDQNGRPVEVKTSNRAGELAVAGAVAGGLAGYLSSIEKHRANQEELRIALGRHENDRVQYSELGQRLADLGNCRNQQIFDVRTQMDAGGITPERADSRLTKIDEWIVKDDQIIDKASGMDAQSVTRYAQAVAVADGISPAEAEQQGELVLARYSRGSERMISDVSVSYDSSNATEQASVPEVPASVEAFVKSRSGAKVRAQPSTQAPVIGSLPFQSKIEVLESPVQGWSKVTLNGQTGYVSDTLLSQDRPVAPPVIKKPTVPRPDLAPGRIAVKPKATAKPSDRQSAVTMAIAERDSFKAINNSRRTSNQQQMATSRNRVAAALQAARS